MLCVVLCFTVLCWVVLVWVLLCCVFLRCAELVVLWFSMCYIVLCWLFSVVQHLQVFSICCLLTIQIYITISNGYLSKSIYTYVF